MLKDFLQGKWLGHPLHPALVHVPMGLFPAALVFDVLSRAGIGGNAMARTSFACVAAGLLVALISAPAGMADWLAVKPGRPAHTIGLTHMGLNVVAIVLWAVNLGLRWGDVGSRPRVAWGELALSILGTALVLVSGYLGSRMVFDQGTGVARYSKKRWRELALAGGSNVPPSDTGGSP